MYGPVTVDAGQPNSGGANGDTLGLAFAAASNPTVVSGNPSGGTATYSFSNAPNISFSNFEQVTTDAVAPYISSSAYEYNSATPDEAVTFTENVGNALTSGAFTVTNTTTNTTLASSLFTTSYNTHNNTARLTYTGSANGVLPDGQYKITIPAGAIDDSYGNASMLGYSSNFFVLAGDVNHDAKVNFTDLLIVAQNYGKSGKTFATGNVDYSSDGSVNFSDLLILAQHYGKVLPASVVFSSPTPMVVQTSDTRHSPVSDIF